MHAVADDFRVPTLAKFVLSDQHYVGVTDLPVVASSAGLSKRKGVRQTRFAFRSQFALSAPARQVPTGERAAEPNEIKEPPDA